MRPQEFTCELIFTIKTNPKSWVWSSFLKGLPAWKGFLSERALPDVFPICSNDWYILLVAQDKKLWIHSWLFSFRLYLVICQQFLLPLQTKFHHFHHPNSCYHRSYHHPCLNYCNSLLASRPTSSLILLEIP